MRSRRRRLLLLLRAVLLGFSQGVGMENVLVTGGAGFIGSHVAEYLLNAGYNVVVLDDLSGGFVENVEGLSMTDSTTGQKRGVVFVQGSILNHELVNCLFAQYKFTYVYHLAAYAAEGLSHFIKRFNYQNNLVGSVNLIDAAVNHGVKCFVFISSMAVYGSSQVPMSEDMIPAPEDSYGIAKAAVESELAISRQMFGLDYVIFRPHNVIGPRQNIGDRYRNVVGIFMNQLLKGESMPIFGDGEQMRAFSYIDDIVPTIANAPTVPEAIGQVFNIGGDIPSTINQLADVVAEAMGCEKKILHLETRHEVKLAFCSHDRVKRVFGDKPLTSLKQGIGLMAEWVKKHGARESKAFQGIEITKNLPASWRRS
jgi:UDP-glucose 4-epimerase